MIILSYIYYFVISSSFSLHIRWLTKKKDLQSSEQILFTFQIIFILFLGSLTFPFFSHFYIAGNYLYLTFLALVCGVFGIGTNLLGIITQKHLDAGVTALVVNIYTPITIFLSSILLHEGLTAMQIFGTILLLVAVVIVSKKHHLGSFKFDKYFLLLVLSSALLGFLLVAERELQITTGFSAGMIMSWGAQAFCLGLVALFTKSKQAYTNYEVIGTGILKFFSSTSWVALVYIVGNLSLVSSITTFKVIVVFIAAAIFLGEREDIGRKIIGSVIAVLGLLLMK